MNSAIRKAQGRPEPEDEQQSGQKPAQALEEYISVAEAAERINRAQRTVREWCRWGWIVGARKLDKKGKGWIIPAGSLEGALKHVCVYHATKTKAVQVPRV